MSRLILIPTPIGNLEDITLRSIRLLKEVDMILAEDTRKTKKLLKHLTIKTSVSSYHQYNEHKTIDNHTWARLGELIINLTSSQPCAGLSTSCSQRSNL